MSEPTNFRDL